ncbi:sulfotransferase domain-containing protein [Kaustia mangrovi]|uniref:Sulfotransferase domain-containing protein n=1 Tax=Kaustia mangrovi TaxID=2593653 RepID=A0A7S8C222_9HYPH|nr:sulfotransferase domain-containing protein [Kaustia mangrovi]QPC41857.1 sulfotransferase domain-containing protein [Kaustia mangrovi]
MRNPIASVKDWLQVEQRLFLRDNLVLSFPKSGRTWLRVMLDELDIPARYFHANYKQPTVLTERDRRVPRRYRHVLVLVRDPRDVVVSAYHSHLKREGRQLDSLGDLVRDPAMGIETIIRYNLFWAQQARAEPFMGIATYEHLRADTEDALAGIAAFFGAQRSSAAVGKAVEECRLERMREREARGEYSERYGDILTPGDPKDPNSFKVRQGKAGGYRTEMSAEDIAFCDGLMERLDYFETLNACLREASASPRQSPWLYAPGNGTTLQPQPQAERA